ncbi:hypothetical protein C8Q75DRAFT_803179 [Abortiporus biennis]|nr:hypothetical protein C8Q75DRAFT_803179 [Abortiporus biennis]
MSSPQTTRWNSKPSPIITTYTAPPSPSDVPCAVQTLLGLTKQLQDMLRLWSLEQASETQVSDAYILVGMQFNATVNAFARHHIDMSDLFSIPTELRNVLENCLGEDPSPRVLDHYMPKVRAVIYKLLQGLQTKQSPYKKHVESQHRGSASPSPRWSSSSSSASPTESEYRRIP